MVTTAAATNPHGAHPARPLRPPTPRLDTRGPAFALLLAPVVLGPTYVYAALMGPLIAFPGTEALALGLGGLMVALATAFLAGVGLLRRCTWTWPLALGSSILVAVLGVSVAIVPPIMDAMPLESLLPGDMSGLGSLLMWLHTPLLVLLAAGSFLVPAFAALAHPSNLGRQRRHPGIAAPVPGASPARSTSPPPSGTRTLLHPRCRTPRTPRSSPGSTDGPSSR